MNNPSRQLCSCIVLLLATISLHASKPTVRPNILWIIAEDMSPDLGCYGNQAVATPHIDRLAKQGMRFDKVFTTSPACSPSRTALATGVYQTTLGAHHMRYSAELRPDLPEGVVLLPQLLREKGYYTGNIRKVCGTGTGKDDWLFKVKGEVWDTDSWDSLVQHQPFYAQINSSNSHRPFSSAGDKSVDTGAMKIPPYYPDHAVTREDWAGYLREIAMFDSQVGAVLEKLKADGLDQNTIVCVFSDHGRPMIRAKNWLYDSGTRIPLIIYYPPGLIKPQAYQAGTTNSQLLSAIDLTAQTVLMAGGTIPQWMQGRGFLEKGSKERHIIITAADRFGNIESCSRSVRSDRYKYIRNYKSPGSINESTTAYRRAKHPIYHLLNIMGERKLLNAPQSQLLQTLAIEELYDLAEDPYEIKNLAASEPHQRIKQKLVKELDEWVEASKDLGLEEDSLEIVEHFRMYGETQMKKNHENIRRRREAVLTHFEEKQP